jgi:hypothetical protein
MSLNCIPDDNWWNWVPGYLNTNWFLANPVKIECSDLSGDDVLIHEGSGSDCSTHMNAYGILNAASSVLGESVQALYPGGLYLSELAFKNILKNVRNKDRDHVWTLAALANIDLNNTTTYDCLIDIRNNAVDENGKSIPYEHLPLINIILHDFDRYYRPFIEEYYNQNYIPCTQPNPSWQTGGPPDYCDDIEEYYTIPHVDCNNSEFNYYKYILNSAPNCFPGSYFGDQFTTTNRLIWPPDDNLEDHRQFNGLDYMMLHNLFYIVFRREDYKKLIITDNYNNDTTWAIAGEIEANNEISGGDVTYQATNKQVSLKPGFSAGDGVEFAAKLLPHDGCYSGKNFRILNIDPCYENKSIISQTTDSTMNLNGNIDEFSSNDSSYQSLADSEISIDIYPNPANVFITIEINNTQLDNKKVIVLNDLAGREILREKSSSNLIKLNIDNIENGLYLINIIINDRMLTKKLVIK